MHRELLMLLLGRVVCLRDCWVVAVLLGLACARVPVNHDHKKCNQHASKTHSIGKQAATDRMSEESEDSKYAAWVARPWITTCELALDYNLQVCSIACRAHLCHSRVTLNFFGRDKKERFLRVTLNQGFVLDQCTCAWTNSFPIHFHKSSIYCITGTCYSEPRYCPVDLSITHVPGAPFHFHKLRRRCVEIVVISRISTYVSTKSPQVAADYCDKAASSLSKSVQLLVTALMQP